MPLLELRTGADSQFETPRRRGSPAPNRSRQRMNHTEDNPDWQFGQGSLDSGPEDDVLFDYSKLLARESNSDPARQARADRAKSTADATPPPKTKRV